MALLYLTVTLRTPIVSPVNAAMLCLVCWTSASSCCAIYMYHSGQGSSEQLGTEPMFSCMQSWACTCGLTRCLRLTKNQTLTLHPTALPDAYLYCLVQLQYSRCILTLVASRQLIPYRHARSCIDVGVWVQGHQSNARSHIEIMLSQLTTCGSYVPAISSLIT